MTTMRADVATLQAPKTEQAQSQKGSVLVEFAIILPIFLSLLFAMITFSVAMYNKTVLTMATREGARAGVLYSATRTNTTAETTAEGTALHFLNNNLISFGSGTPTVTAAVDANNNLKVIATFPYTGLYIFLNDIPTISAQTSMRLE